jgi:hypothetical protein
MGVVESMSGFCQGLGFILGGVVAAVSEPRATFVMAGTAAALAAGAFALLAGRGQIARRQHASSTLGNVSEEALEPVPDEFAAVAAERSVGHD